MLTCLTRLTETKVMLPAAQTGHGAQEGMCARASAGRGAPTEQGVTDITEEH